MPSPKAEAADPVGRLHYQSYLLRVWRESPEGNWRVLLENVASHQKHAFTQIGPLIEFLKKDAFNLNPTATDTSEPSSLNPASSG